ncbi:MAG: fibronectin type III domain-containing protein [Actinomycetia bacterium]|nr:fibronectin type III domain-containing protein [Actinomycetes bacterium]
MASTARMPAGALRVSWQAPEGQLAGYVLAWASTTAPSGQHRVRVEQTSTVLTGLRPGAEYQVRVAAVRWDGTVTPAAVVQVSLPQTSQVPGDATGDESAPGAGADS